MGWLWIPIVCAAGLLLMGYWQVAVAFLFVGGAGIIALKLTDLMAGKRKRQRAR